jgi:hypothetical protein
MTYRQPNARHAAQAEERAASLGLFTALCTLLTCGLTFTAFATRGELTVPPAPRPTLTARISDACTFCNENLRWPSEGNATQNPCTQCDGYMPEHGLLSDSFFPEPPPPPVRLRPLRLASTPTEIHVSGPLPERRALRVVRRHRDEIQSCARQARVDELSRAPEGNQRAAGRHAPRYREHVLSILVQPHGSTQTASFAQQGWPTHEGPMQTCLRRLATRWNFEASAPSLVRVHLHCEPL